MPIGEPTIESMKPKKEEAINISADNLEADLGKAFSGIEKDIRNAKIEGDTITTIEGDDVEALAASVDEAFGPEANNIEVDWTQESKTVVAVAEQKLFDDEEIGAYMKDSEYEGIVRQVVSDMTTNEEQIRIFQEGLNLASDKAKYVEQATNKLADAMKKEAQKRIMDSVTAQEGNA